MVKSYTEKPPRKYENEHKNDQKKKSKTKKNECGNNIYSNNVAALEAGIKLQQQQTVEEEDII